VSGGMRPHSTGPASGRWSGTPVQCLAKRLEVENLRQESVQYAVPAVRIPAILIAAAVAVFIAAPETLAEIVVVVVLG